MQNTTHTMEEPQKLMPGWKNYAYAEAIDDLMKNKENPSTQEESVEQMLENPSTQEEESVEQMLEYLEVHAKLYEKLTKNDAEIVRTSDGPPPGKRDLPPLKIPDSTKEREFLLEKLKLKLKLTDQTPAGEDKQPADGGDV